MARANWIDKFIFWIFQSSRERAERERLILSAIEELTAAITALTTAVNALIVAYQTPSATEAQILAAAKACNDLTTAVNAALTPVNPPPTS